ncbi:MAG: accessory gene regulator B family protein [Ruminococcus sp.]|nr:accessory gene regulator B family protein [Ruminococcus sp.]
MLITRKIISVDERDIYMYGLEVILLNGSLLLVFLIISLLCGEMTNFWAYLVFFLPLRIFSGGYHAETSERCFVLSTVMYVMSIAASSFLPFLYQSWQGRIIGVISVLVILVSAPLVNKNNPLNQSQRKRNRIIICILLIIDLIFFILSCNCSWKIASNELIFIIFDAVLLLMGRLPSRQKEDNELS